MRSTMRTVLGGLLLLYGLASVGMAVVAYNVTHEAYTNVRTFANRLKAEQERVAGAIQGVTGILGRGGSGQSGGPISSLLPGGRDGGRSGDSAKPGESGSSGDGGSRLGETLRGIFGGGSRATPTPAPAPSATPQPTPAPAEDGGVLGRLRGDIEGRLAEITRGVGGLGDGPMALRVLDQVELVTNVVLVWFGLHGVVSAIIGLRWLSTPARVTVVYGPPPGYGPQAGYPPYPPRGPSPPPYPPQYPPPYPPPAPPQPGRPPAGGPYPPPGDSPTQPSGRR